MSFKLDKNTLRFLSLIAVLVLCGFIGRYGHLDQQQYQSFFAQFPIGLSAFIFILVYVAVTLLSWLAKEILKPIGAVLFGAYGSTLLIWIAETINAVIIFSLSRRLGREFIENKFKTKIGRIDRKVETSGFWGLFVLRAVPLVSFQILDLACGLTKFPWKKYFWIVLLASPLRIFWVQFILAGVGTAFFKDPNILMEYLSKNSFLFVLSFIYVIAAISVAVKIQKEWASTKSSQ